MPTTFVEVGTWRIRVCVEGDGDPLLLINGLAGNIESWGPLPQLLRGHQVITFDAPGAGLSTPPLLPLSMAGHARLARRVLDALEIDRADVLGLSFGGGVAQTLAYRHTGKVRRLILAATACGWGGVPGNPIAVSLLATPYRYYSPSFYRAVAPILFGGSAQRSEAELDYIVARTARRPTIRGFYGQLLAMVGWSSFAWLPRIAQPTLVLAGDDDPLVPLTNAHIMATRLPHAELQVIEGGGHLFLWEDAAASAEIILRFLDRSELSSQ